MMYRHALMVKCKDITLSRCCLAVRNNKGAKQKLLCFQAAKFISSTFDVSTTGMVDLKWISTIQPNFMAGVPQGIMGVVRGSFRRRTLLVAGAHAPRRIAFAFFVLCYLG